MALGHRHRVSRRVTLGVLMIALTAGLGYLIFRQGWSPTVGQVSGVLVGLGFVMMIFGLIGKRQREN